MTPDPFIFGRLKKVSRYAFSLLLVAVSCCATAAADAAKPVILVSIPPQAFFVSQIAGGLVETQAMLPAGVNHETYEPQMKQLRAFTKAAMYIKLGHPAFSFETVWIDKLLAGNPQLKVIDNNSATPGIDKSDFHLWTSPENGRAMVAGITAGLLELFPEKREELLRASEALLKKIETLDSELKGELLPFTGCSFLTFHPAWAYFAHRYGLVQRSVETEGKEPGIVGIQKLISASHGMHTFIIEPSSPQEMSAEIGKSLHVEPKVIDPLAEDWIENLRMLGKYLQANLAGCEAGK